MKNLMKALSIAVMLVLLIPSISSAQTKANFDGTWVFNADKSNVGGSGQGGGRGFGGGDMTVKQEANLLTVSTTRPGRDGGSPVTITMKYTLDGKESINTARMGDSKSTASWSADGKSLTIKTSRNFNMNGQTRSMNTTEVWTLNGNDLSIVTTSATPNGERTFTRVYNKK